jgi:uncharacterized membrane protein
MMSCWLQWSILRENKICVQNIKFLKLIFCFFNFSFKIKYILKFWLGHFVANLVYYSMGRKNFSWLDLYVGKCSDLL